MNILTYTNLYPNSIDPTHGIFVERRLLMLARHADICPVVIAPVPWFPSKARIFGRHGAMARIPGRETRNGVVVHHPRYPLVPKVGMAGAPYAMSFATGNTVRMAINTHGVVEVIDAHYFYPDGVAAAMLARKFDIPYVITARGSDINLIARYALPRRLMVKAAAGAAALVAVSQALADEMIRLGMPAERIHVLRNGVDLEFFTPDERSRPAGSYESFLCVGALKAAKGQDIAIRFVAGLDAAHLTIAGAGPDEQRLRRLCGNLGVSKRVHFAGVLDPESLRDCYRRADALILMSEREGMPNVVLESLACGTPVLAANVGGIAEIMSAEVGVLLSERSDVALAAAWRDMQNRGIDRHAVRRHAEQYSWADTVAGLGALMRACAGSGHGKSGSWSHKSH